MLLVLDITSCIHSGAIIMRPPEIFKNWMELSGFFLESILGIITDENL